MLRKLGRAVALAVLVIAGPSTLVWTAAAIFNGGDSDVLLGGILLAVMSVATGVAAWFIQRALRGATQPADEPMAGLPGLSEDAGWGGRRLSIAAVVAAACVATVLLVT